MIDSDIDDDILDKYETLKQSGKMTDIKESLRKKLEQQLVNSLPTWRPIEIVLVGSSYNRDMAMEDSDLDIAIAIGGYDGNYAQKLTGVKSCYNIMGAKHRFIGDELPALQFCLTTGKEDMPEMKVNAQIYCTDVAKSKILIRLLMRADRRLAPLAVILKQWAKAHNIHDANLGRLSGHAIVLLLIQYLQCEVDPAQPCLHKLYPEAINDPNLKAMLRLEPELANTKFHAQQKLDYGKLLIGFFKYYGFDFDFSTTLVSVRDGEPRQRKPGDNNFINVEEPFGLTNVTKTIKSVSVYNQILSACRSSYDTLTGGWSLEYILGRQTIE